jgi:hypothetical protein
MVYRDCLNLQKTKFTLPKINSSTQYLGAAKYQLLSFC